MQSSQDGFIIFIEKDPAAISVAESELIPEGLSYKLISYNHHSMKSNLDAKRQTLLILADLLEPQRGALEYIEKQFASFVLFI